MTELINVVILLRVHNLFVRVVCLFVYTKVFRKYKVNCVNINDTCVNK